MTKIESGKVIAFAQGAPYIEQRRESSRQKSNQEKKLKLSHQSGYLAATPTNKPMN